MADHTQTSEIEVGTVPAQVSDRRCPAGNHLLGAEVFWCVTCNEYAEGLMLAEQQIESSTEGTNHGNR